MIPEPAPEAAAPFKLLPLTFEKNGWHYEMVERTAKAAIYRQFRDGRPAVAFEVVRVRAHPPRTVTFPNGKTSDLVAGEYLPRTEEWGRYGWTFLSLPEARKRTALLSEPAAQETA